MKQRHTIANAISLSAEYDTTEHAEHVGPAEIAVAGIGADYDYVDCGGWLDVWGDTDDGQPYHIIIHLTGGAQ